MSSTCQKGSALIVVLLLAASLALLGGAFLTVSFNDRQIVSNEVQATQAFDLADAGLDHAVEQLKDEDADTLLAAGGALFTNQSLGPGTYSVTIANNKKPEFPIPAVPADDGGATDDTDGYLVVTSTGRVGEAERRLQIIVQGTGGASMPPIFQWAAFAGSSLKASGSGNFSGPVGTNGSMTFSGESPKITGDAYAGGTVPSGWTTGTVTQGAPAISLPPVACPATAYGPAPTGDGITFNAGSGKLTLNGANAYFGTGSYYFSEISKSGGGTIHAPTGGAAKIYVSSKISMSGGGFNNPDAKAENLQIYGCGTSSGTFTITGGQTSWLTIYAPYKDIKFTGGGDKYGSFIGNKFENSGPGDAKHDGQLNAGGPLTFTPLPSSWTEIL